MLAEPISGQCGESHARRLLSCLLLVIAHQGQLVQAGYQLGQLFQVLFADDSVKSPVRNTIAAIDFARGCNGTPLTTVFHMKRGNNCVFESLLDFSRIICPRVMMYVSF